MKILVCWLCRCRLSFALATQKLLTHIGLCPSVSVFCYNCFSLLSFTLPSSAQPSMQGLWEPGAAPVTEDPQSYNIFGTSSIWGPVQENRAAVPWMTALKTPESSPSLGEGRDKKGKFPESSPFE